jgi:hypothetical protein
VDEPEFERIDPLVRVVAHPLLEQADARVELVALLAQRRATEDVGVAKARVERRDDLEDVLHLAEVVVELAMRPVVLHGAQPQEVGPRRRLADRGLLEPCPRRVVREVAERLRRGQRLLGHAALTNRRARGDHEHQAGPQDHATRATLGAHFSSRRSKATTASASTAVTYAAA